MNNYEKIISASSGQIQITTFSQALIYINSQKIYHRSHPTELLSQFAGCSKLAAKYSYIETYKLIEDSDYYDNESVPYDQFRKTYISLKRNGLPNLAKRLFNKILCHAEFVSWVYDRQPKYILKANDLASDIYGRYNVPRDVILSEREYYIPTVFYGRYGYKNPFDMWAIDPIFDTALPFFPGGYTGYAAVEIAGKWGIIDCAGRFFLDAEYDKPPLMKKASYFIVTLNGRQGIVDLIGHIYWEDELCYKKGL